MESIIYDKAAVALKAALSENLKHFDHDDRNTAIKAVRNTFPESMRPDIWQHWVDFRCRNSKSRMTDREAKAELDSTLSNDYRGFSTATTLARLLRDKGAKTDLAALREANTEPKDWTPKTDAERYCEIFDKILCDAERSVDFLNGRASGESWNRRTELNHTLERGEPASSHRYVMKKSLPVAGPARISSTGQLIVPMTSALYPDEWANAQEVSEEGQKKFKAGGPTRGLFYPIGNVVDADVVIVCEGMATGEALHAATGLPVACALSLHNLLPTAVGLLHEELEVRCRRILFAADTGHDDAMIRAVRVLRTQYQDDRVDWIAPKDTKSNFDFDDLRQRDGLDAVGDAIREAISAMGRPTATAKNAGRVLTFTELLAMPKPRMLVADLVVESGLTALVGPTGSYKSFFAIELAMATALGVPFHGRKTTQGAVLVVAGEGLVGIRARVLALLGAREWPKPCPEDFLVRHGVSLLDPVDQASLRELIRTHEVKLVVIDTLARSFVGDENSSKDISAAISAIDANILAEGAACLLVHHTGHGDQTRARGSSAFRAALDIEIGIEKIGLDQIKVVCRKTKDAEPFRDCFFKRVIVATENGESSLILEPTVSATPVAAFRASDATVAEALRGLASPFTLKAAQAVAYTKIQTAHKGRVLERVLSRMLEAGELEQFADQFVRPS